MRTEQPQVAFGKDGKVSIWCDVTQRLAGGDFDFHVINGRWDGRYVASTGKLLVNATGHWYDAKIIWEGKAPFAGWRYNEAVDWIEKQVAAGTLDRPARAPPEEGMGQPPPATEDRLGEPAQGGRG